MSLARARAAPASRMTNRASNRAKLARMSRRYVIRAFASATSQDVDDVDRERMRQALALASEAIGKTFPNPVVGCVIVDANGNVVGRGYHPKAGEPHAEVFALRAAGERARGGTAYVTLEPCNHFGRTPPCSRALVDAGVRRVVVGFVDPDPRVSGGGIKTLLNAGIDVALGCEEERCREINAEFIARQLEGK